MEAQDEAFEEHLESLLEEAEQTVRELRTELKELRTLGKKESDEARQHAEIERLEEYLAQTRVDWSRVRDFFVEAVHEVRAKKEN